MEIFSQLYNRYFSETLGGSLLAFATMIGAIFGWRSGITAIPFIDVLIGALLVLMITYSVLLLIDNRFIIFLFERIYEKEANRASHVMAVLGTGTLITVLLSFIPSLVTSGWAMVGIIAGSILVYKMVLQIAMRAPASWKINKGVPVSIRNDEFDRVLSQIFDRFDGELKKSRQDLLIKDLEHCLLFGILPEDSVDVHIKRFGRLLHVYEAKADWHRASQLAGMLNLQGRGLYPPSIAARQLSKTLEGSFIVQKTASFVQWASGGVRTVPEQLSALSTRLQAELSLESPERISAMLMEAETVLDELNGEDAASTPAIMLERSIGAAYHKIGQEEKGQAIISNATRRLLLSYAGGTIAISTEGGEPVNFGVDELFGSKEDDENN